MNFSRLFGVDAEYMYYNLSIRPSVANGPANLHNTSGRLQSISLDGIVNVPYHRGKLHAYGIFGVGFYQRSVSATSEVLEANKAICQPIWTAWFGINCLTGTPTTKQTLSSFSKGAGGFNVGGGVTYPLNHLNHSKIYIEWRYHRAYQSDGKTIVMPITVGLRW